MAMFRPKKIFFLMACPTRSPSTKSGPSFLISEGWESNRLNRHCDSLAATGMTIYLAFSVIMNVESDNLAMQQNMLDIFA
jgi:hypothetical protein